MFTSFSSSDKITEKAKKFIEKGKFDKAVQVFEGPLKKDPKDLDLLLGLAEVFCIIEEPQAAIREYRKAYKSHNDKARTILGILESPPGNAAVKEFNELRIEILIHLHQFDQALEVIGKISESLLKRILERTQSRMNELKKISSSGQDTLLIVELGYLSGLIHESQSSYTAAFSAYSAILEIREEELLHLLPRLEKVVSHIKKSAAPFLYMGDLMRKQDREKAAAYYNKVLDLDKKAASDVIERFEKTAKGAKEFWILGRSYLFSSAWLKAVDTFQKIKEESLQPPIIKLLKGVDPSTSGAELLFLFLGDLNLKVGHFSEASDIYSSLTGKVEADLLRKRFQRLVELDPENMNAAHAFGEICLDEGDLGASLTQMRKIIKSDASQAEVILAKALPLLQDHFEDAELTFFLAELCMDDAEVEKPLVLLRRFIQLAPDQAERALPWLRRLIQKAPSHPLIRVAEAQAMMALGKDPEAFLSFQVALSLDPGTLAETLHSLSLLARKSAELSTEIRTLFTDLEGRGIKDPALYLVWAEAALSGGAFDEAVKRALQCASELPEKADMIESLMQGWLTTHPGQLELILGIGELYLRTERDEDLLDLLDHYLVENPDQVEKVVSFYRHQLQKNGKRFPLYHGLLSAYMRGGIFDLVLGEGKKLEKKFSPAQSALLHRTMGDACKELGRFTDAVSLYYQAFKEDPSSAEAIAISLQKVLEMNPSLPKASLALGMVLASCDKVGEGVECLLQLVRDVPKSLETVMKYLGHIAAKHPMHVKPILGMAELQIQIGQFEPALDLLWKAIQRDSKESNAILGLLDQIEEKNPDMARVHLEMGKVYLNAGIYAKAADQFVSSVQMDLSLSEQGIKFCHDILAADSKEVAAYNAISRILVQLNRHHAAVTFLSSSADSHPDIREALMVRMEEAANDTVETPEILKCLASNYLKAGKLESSLSAMKKAFTMEPTLAKEGVSLFTDILEQQPDHAEAMTVRGVCRIKVLELEGAFDDIRQAIRLEPHRIDQGIKMLIDLKEKGLCTAEFYLFLGGLYSRKREYEAGIELLQESLEKVSQKQERAQLLIQLAELHEIKGDMGGARTLLDAAKELSDDQNFFYRKLNEFAVQKILFETRAWEQEAERNQTFSQENLHHFITHLVLLGRQEEAEKWIRKLTLVWDPEDVREAWGHFHEETGNYFMAAQCSGRDEIAHRVHLLERSGENLLAASILEEAIKTDQDPHLSKQLENTCVTLMEESLLQEKGALMGETFLRLSSLPDAG